MSMNDSYEKLAAGGGQAWKRLYDEVSPGLYRFILSRVGDSSSAQDIMQEGFFRLARSLGKLKDSQAVKSWLYSTCYRLTVDWHRHNSHFQEEDLGQVRDLEDDPLTRVIQQEEDEGVLKDVMSVSDPHRTVLMLRIWGELSYSEISEITGLSEGTLRSQFYWAVRKLRRLLKSGESEKVVEDVSENE